MTEEYKEINDIEDVDLAEGADEMFEHFAITVDRGQNMLRLDK
jgi:hypothetical protein